MNRGSILIAAAICFFLASCDSVFYSLASSGNEGSGSGSGEYVVRFDKNGGDTEANPQSINVNSPAIAVEVLPQVEPKRDGFIFEGWNTSPDGTSKNFFADTPVTKNTTVYAVWYKLMADSHVVSFDKNNDDAGSQEAYSQTMASKPPNSSVNTLPVNPVRNGYDFSKWNTAANGGGSEFTKDTPVNGNITVYAQWIANTYTVTFNPNGGSGSISNQSFTYDVAQNLTANTFTRTGYTFAGWARTSGGAIVYSDGESVNNLTTVKNGTVSLFAKWNPITYTVNYNANEGSGTMEPSIHTYDAAKNLTPNKFTRTNFAFVGWAEDTVGPVKYNDGQSVRNLTTVPGGTFDLYAQWVPGYTVTFDKNNTDSGSTEANPASKPVIYPKTNVGTLPTPPTRTGYTFNGWNTDSDGNDIPAFTASTMVTVDITVYAQWKPNTYNITYRDVGNSAFSGTHGAGYPTTHIYGTETTLVSPIKIGYTFDGWFDNSGGTGTALTSLDATGYTANITLYAKWTANTYEITYRDVTDIDFTGTHGLGYPTEHTYGKATPLVSPTKTGYAFNGWFTNSGGTGAAITSLSATGYSTNITLYAKWTIQTYNITYRDVGGGSFSGTHESGYPTTHAYGAVTALKNATKNNYEFGGWFINSDGSGTAITTLAATAYTANITLHAKWIGNSYTITYKDIGDDVDFSGSPAGLPTTHIYGTATTLVSPTKSGATFRGWFINSNGTGTALTSLSATGYTADITLYAKWIESFDITYMDVGPVPFTGTHGSNYPTSHISGTATTLVSPTKTGYTFEGWFRNDDGSGIALTSLAATAVTANITLYAKWTVQTYTITYRDVGGGTFSGSLAGLPTTHTYDTATLLVDVTKNNYIFGGWFDNSGGTGTALTFLSATGYTANITLYAKWIGDPYTITYRDVGDTTFSGTHGSGYPTTHNYGTATTLVSPTKTGYAFNGWFGNPGGTGTALTSLSATGYTDNITLYAKWTAQSYTITYRDVGGGTFSGSLTGLPTKHTYDMPTILVDPTRTGYTFGGWFINSDGSGTVLTTLGATDYTANITLYAKWTTTTYNITYLDVGGGGFTGTHGPGYPQSHTYGTPTALVSPTKTGYTFGGWFTASAGTGTALTSLGATTTGPITLHAKWTALIYTITYRDVGDTAFSGTHGSGNPTRHTYGTLTTLVNPTKTGCTFEGWFIDRDGMGTALATLSATGYTANIILYAKWTGATYTITYKDIGNNIDFSGVHGPGHPTTHTYGTATPLVSPTKTGYTFGGWFAASAGTGTALTSLGATAYTANITLYAKWTASIYTITYMDVGDEAFTGAHGAKYPTTHTFGTATPLVSPTKTNYTFGGWFDNSSGSGTALTTLSATGYTANITLYAKWIDIYTVTFNSNGGNNVASQKVDSGKTVSMPTNPTRSGGYIFNGWYSNSGMTVLYDFDTPVTKDIILYAQWKFSVSGHVYLDVSGNPANGATVQLILPNWDNLSASTIVDDTTTDTTGSYIFYDVETGKGYVIVALYNDYDTNAKLVEDNHTINLVLLYSGTNTRRVGQGLNLQQLLLPLKK